MRVLLAAATKVWLGFDHHWEREVFGALTTHRLGAMTSWLDDDTLHVGMGPGVNGDFAFPQASFATLGAALPRGAVTFTLEDRLHAGSASVNHSAPVPPGAVLGGLELAMRCLPAAGTCNSDAVWPTRLEVRLADGRAVFALGRAWTPTHGGGKPLSTAMQYNVTLHWVDAGVARPQRHELRGTLRSGTRGWQGSAGPSALTGFGFALGEGATAGRYLEGLAFGVRPGADRPWQWRADVWASRTVLDSPLHTWVELAALPAFQAFGTANGTVCADDRAFPYTFTCARKGLKRQLVAAVPLPGAAVLV